MPAISAAFQKEKGGNVCMCICTSTHTLHCVNDDFFPSFSIVSSLCVCVRMHAQSCSTLWDSMKCSPPGSSGHGILWARMLERVIISSSWGSSRPRDRTHVSCISCTGKRILYHCTTWEALVSSSSPNSPLLSLGI